jgi:hypothetical protein
MIMTLNKDVPNIISARLVYRSGEIFSSLGLQKIKEHKTFSVTCRQFIM